VNPDDGPEKWKEVEFKGEGNGVCVWGGLVSTLTARKLVSKRGQVYLAYVKEEGRKEMRLMRISIAREFLKVFLEDLPGLPLGREVEVSIKFFSGMAPMSQNPYRMAQLNS
jgi:hypothetical protein